MPAIPHTPLPPLPKERGTLPLCVRLAFARPSGDGSAVSHARSAILLVLAAAAGFLSHCGPFWLLPAAFLLPAAWTAAGSRRQAAAVALAYYLTASRALPIGATLYFGELTLAVALWLGAGAVLAATWGALWHRRRRVRLLLLPLLLIFVAVPPVGIVGWGHPITAAGALFPGWGWFGLATAALALVAIAGVALRQGMALTAVAIVAAYVVEKSPDGLPGWQAVDTTFPFSADRDLVRDFERIVALRAIANQDNADVVVFAESLGGLWTPTTERLWREPGLGTAVVCGAELPLARGYDNAVVAVTAAGSSILYRQRMPVPFSMWRPFATNGARAHWFENPTFEYKGKRFAPLICYEQVLVWPILHSAAHRPDAVLAIANDWWCADTSLPSIQSNATRAWARLFALRLVTATNR